MHRSHSESVTISKKRRFSGFFVNAIRKCGSVECIESGTEFKPDFKQNKLYYNKSCLVKSNFKIPKLN